MSWARERAAAFGAAAAGGVLLALAGPSTDFVPGIWLGPACFYAAISLSPPVELRRPTVRGKIGRAIRMTMIGLAFGFVVNTITFRFVPAVIVRFTPLGWGVGLLALTLMAWAQALRFAIAELLHRTFVARGVPPVVAFAVAMFAGTWFPMVFPWQPGGGAMAWPAFAQIAELVGERGTTAIYALVSAMLAEAALGLRKSSDAPRARTLGLAGTAIGTLAVLAIGGSVRMSAIDTRRAAAKSLKVALVQPSIEARERWEKGNAERILMKLTDLTKRAEADGAELVVWTEAAYPYQMSERSRRAPIGSYAPLQPGVHGPVLTGTLMYSDIGKTNSAVIVKRDGTLSAPYHKIHLLWFGETVPLADVWPWLRRTFARGIGLTPGEHQVALEDGPVRAAVLNCFEDTLSAAGREASTVNPNLLVNVTNDAWFADSQESALHLRVAAMRTVEQRRDMIRAVNYGPTTWVDATGRIRARRDPPEPGYLMTEPVLLETGPTFFARFGDWPMLVIALGALFGTRRRS